MVYSAVHLMANRQEEPTPKWIDEMESDATKRGKELAKKKLEEIEFRIFLEKA